MFDKLFRSIKLHERTRESKKERKKNVVNDTGKKKFIMNLLLKKTEIKVFFFILHLFLFFLFYFVNLVF